MHTLVLRSTNNFYINSPWSNVLKGVRSVIEHH